MNIAKFENNCGMQIYTQTPNYVRSLFLLEKLYILLIGNVIQQLGHNVIWLLL